MSGTVSCSFRLNLTVMKLFGFYPSEKYTKLYKIYSFVVFILSMSLPIIFGTLHLFVFTENMAIIDLNNFVIVGVVLSTFKLVPFLSNGDEIKKCIHFFDNYVIVNPEHRQIIEECISTCRRNSLVFFSACIVGVIAIVVQALVEETMEKLPLNVWLPTVWKETRSIYFSMYFLSVLGLAYCALSSGIIDPLIGGLCHHAAAHLQILKHCLQFLDENEDGLFSDSYIIYGKIRQCIQRYQEIVEFVHEFQRCFSPVIFRQLTLSVLVIGLCCFQLTVIKVDVNFLVTIFCLPFLVFQLFFYCYYGNLLIEENHTLSSAIYMSRWYEYDERSKKALMTLMERSKRPMVVTAAKVLNLSLETFTLILKRSYSLVAVLNNY